MAKPNVKHPRLQAVLDKIAKERYGISRTDAITSDVCLYCKNEAIDFKDDLSKEEFSISGMCQECQDETFGG